MEKWIRTVRRIGACQGPEGRRYDSYSIDSTEYLGTANSTSPDEARQDETSVLGPSRCCWAGLAWVVGGSVICEM